MIFSASDRYLGHAARALRRRLPEASTSVVELAPEVGRVDGPGVTMARVHEACVVAGSAEATDPGVPFVRHLAAEDELVPPSDLDRLPDVALGLAAGIGVDEVALQAWSSGQVPRRAPEVREEVDHALAAGEVRTSRGGRTWVLTVCLTPAGASVGVNHRDDVLADWPGGRVVLGRPPDQVSRAEWKLEEVLKLVAPLERPASTAGGRSRRVLDLGASPGGWTRILRTRGYEVWAVDPGELHPRVAADPGVHHVVTTAGRFLATTEVEPGHFDLVVNDMRMTPERSCRVMTQAAPLLRPTGLIVTTLKVSTERPMATVERSLAVLAGHYRPVLVRQLFHNKNEVTVVAQKAYRI